MSGSSGIGHKGNKSCRLLQLLAAGVSCPSRKPRAAELIPLCALQGMTGTGLSRRWLAFNGVGLMGVGVQLAWSGSWCMGSTCTISWPRQLRSRWQCCTISSGTSTGPGATGPARRGRAGAARLLRFHLLNGTVSLAGNLAIMAVLSGRLAMEPVPANAVAIVACSTLNFLGQRGPGVQDDDRALPVGRTLGFARRACAPRGAADVAWPS